MMRVLAIVVVLSALMTQAHAADVEELFEEALFAGKLQAGTFDMDGLEESRCWGRADKTDELACVLYGERDERRVWELVVFHPLRGEVARHGLATRVAYDEAKAERGLAAANGALKKARWKSIGPVLSTSGAFKAKKEVALSSGKLIGEGGEVRLGEARVSVVATAPTTSAVWTFYEVAGQVVVLFDRRTAQGDDAQLSRLGAAETVRPGPTPTSACTSCPPNWERVVPLMASLCEERFGDAELAALKAAVGAGELTKDDVALLWNTVGAMTGYVFKQYPTWNTLLRGADAGQVPAACRPWLAQTRKEAELPKAFRATRDVVRAYWKTL